MGMEDTIIEKRFGKKRPFKVPEGYFEGLASQVMQQLPMTETRAISIRPKLWKRYRSAIAVAASVCGIVVGTSIYMHKQNVETDYASNMPASTVAAYSYNTIDYVADYTMLDNEDIYALVSDY